MGLNEVRSALRSHAPMVVVEAPAGCGKTFEALGCAVDVAAEVRSGQEVLLLAHTNVAVSEFRRRARRAKARVHATTIDAFALRLIAPYTSALELPTPLIPGDGPGEIPFRHVVPKALELLHRSPSIAKALRGHYPVILLDEHQDTRQDQHNLAVELGRSDESRLRIFGDPMQAIYGFGDEALVDWETVASAADVRVSLDDPQRWTGVEELGEWILRARIALQDGACLPLSTAPECVRVHRIRELDDVRNPNSDAVTPAIIRVLGTRLRELNGSIAVLTRYNAHVRGLFSAVRGALVVQEGVDFSTAYQALASAETAIGDPQRLAFAAIDLLSKTCRGLDAGLRQQLTESLREDRCVRGRRQRVLTLLDALEPLYTTPDLATWCRAVRGVIGHPPDWLKIDLPESLRLIAALRLTDDGTPREDLEAGVRYRRDAASVPTRCASTIHKAKGQEVDHVIIAHCSATPFSNSNQARRLLYVALSRARKSITILASGSAPSPLLP